MTATYPQHTALLLPAWDSLSPQEQALHLVHDHGFDSDSAFDHLGTDEGIVDLVAGWDTEARDDLHSEDHGVTHDGLADQAFDPDTQTANDHTHYREPVPPAPHVVLAARAVAGALVDLYDAIDAHESEHGPQSDRWATAYPAPRDVLEHVADWQRYADVLDGQE